MSLAPAAFAEGDKADKAKAKSASIEFENGAHALTEDQRSSLREMVNNLPNRGRDLNIGIAAWSDQPYPGTEKELSEDQQDLADKRAEAVESFLEDDMNFEGSISKFNMAEKSNWLARMFDTEGAEIRSVFAEKEQASDDTLKNRYKAYKKKGGPGKVAIVASPKE